MDQIALRIETNSVPPQNRLKGWHWWKLPAGLLLITGLLLFKVRASEIAVQLRHSILPWIVLAGSLHLVGLFLSAFRWRLLLLAQGQKTQLTSLLRLYLSAGFLNYFLPARVGGDFYRMASACKSTLPLVTRFAVVFVEGFSSLCALLMICAGATALNSPLAHIAKPTTVFACLCLLCLALAPTLCDRRFTGRLRKEPSGPPGKVRAVLMQTADVLARFSDARWRVSGALLLSLLLQVNVVLYYYFIFRALGAGVAFSHLCLVVPGVILIQMVPLTPNAVGVREVTSVYLLGHFAGVAGSQTLALCAWDYVLAFSYAVLGGIFYILQRTHHGEC